MGSITKTKTGYRAIVRLGKYRNNPIQKCFKNHRDAKVFIRNQEGLIVNGKCSNSKYPTLNEAFDRYLATVSSKKKTSYYESKIINKFKRELLFADKKLNLITTSEMVAYRDTYLDTHKVSTWQRNLTILKHLWKIAQLEWGYELKNIFFFARKLPKPEPRFRRLTKRELNLLLKGDYTSQLMKNIISLALETGMRRGEILNIKNEHILKNTLLIPLRKNGQKNSQIPLTIRAKEILINSRLPFLIKSEGLKSSWRRMCYKYDIKDLHFHDLRHEALSRYLENGLSIQEVQVISGHKDINTLMNVYGNLSVEKISAKMREISLK